MKITRALSFVLSIALVIISLAGCVLEKDGELSLATSLPHTDYEGIYISIESIDPPSDERTINVVWHNTSSYTATFGVGYFIERLEDDGNWKSVKKSDFAIIEIACVVAPGETSRYSYKTKYFSFKATGTYRIRCEFYVTDENTSRTYQTWAEFDVTKQ